MTEQPERVVLTEAEERWIAEQLAPVRPEAYRSWLQLQLLRQQDNLRKQQRARLLVRELERKFQVRNELISTLQEMIRRQEQTQESGTPS